MNIQKQTCFNRRGAHQRYLNHSGQIQQGFKIGALKYFSYFYYFFVFTRESFLKISTSYLNSVSLYSISKFQRQSKKLFYKFLHFEVLLISFTLCCQSQQSYFLNLDQKQLQKQLEAKLRTHSIQNNQESNFRDDFAIFLKFRQHLISHKAQQISYFFQYSRSL